MLVEGGRLGRAQGVLVPRDVVAMGVRNERPRLTPAKIDRQVGLGQLQSVVPVEHEWIVVSVRNATCADARQSANFVPNRIAPSPLYSSLYCSPSAISETLRGNNATMRRCVESAWVLLQ